jgi:hypothetical protein
MDFFSARIDDGTEGSLLESLNVVLGLVGVVTVQMVVS